MAKLPKTALSQLSAEDCLPPWMLAMREAARAAVTKGDIEEIVKNQIARAKTGDKAAIAFVFDQVLGGNELKGATFIQNVFHSDGPTPIQPAKVRPGSDEKIELMRKRIASGNGAFHKDDGEEVDLN